MLYFDSMAVALPYLNAILEAARRSGRSEREISRTATGQPAALSLIKTGRVPSVERVRLLCLALGLEFYIGPPRERTTRGDPDAARARAHPSSGNDVTPPGVEILRADLREDLTALLRESDSRRVAESASPRETPPTGHVEIRELVARVSGGTRTTVEQVASRVAFRRDWLDRYGLDPTRCILISVQGASMEPVLPDGSSILVDRGRRQLRDGRTFVIRTRDGLVMRRAGRDAGGRLVLMNEHLAWQSAALPGDAEVLGEARWIGTFTRSLHSD